MGHTPGRGAGVVIVAFLALMAAGCGREASPARPPTATVVVEGRVGPVAPGHNVEIEFDRVGAPDAFHTFPVDAAGAYRAELPVGDYRAALRGALPSRQYLARAGGSTTFAAEAETLRLREGSQPWRRDFGLGALRLVMDGLEDFEGWDGQASLYRVQADTAATWSQGSETDGVDGGVLDLQTLPLAPGTWQLKLTFRRTGTIWGHTESVWIASSGTTAAPDRLRVGPDSLTTHRPPPLRPAVLSGVISGAWQALSVRPPQVQAWGTDGEVASTLSETEADGSFRLLLTRARPVSIRLGQGDHTWIGGDDASSATVFRPEPGQVIAGITGAVGGLLVRPNWTVPVQPLETYFVEIHDATTAVLLRTVAASGGRWGRLGDLRPGTYHIRLANEVERALWRPQWYDRAASAEASALVVIPADGTLAVIDPVLERGGAIHGTVTGDEPGTSQVFITTADEPVVVGYRDITAAEAAFAFTGLAEGRFRIGVVSDFDWLWRGGPAPVGTLWYPGVTDWEAAGDLEIVDTGVITGVQVGAPPAR